jgi:hypothetical protein
MSQTRNDTDKGLRYNVGKTRHDLVPAFAQEQYARVLTKGAEKYADRNWEKGMQWSKVLESMKRHVLAFERGEDYDPETGCLHMAHVMCNAAFLTEYYKIFPQGDNRPHEYLRRPKIGLDIDEVLCDWVGGWQKYFGKHNTIDDRPTCWNFDYTTSGRFKSLPKEVLEELYINLPVKISPSDIPFEPHCYITSRSVPVELTKQWLQKNGFSTAPVYSIGFGESKIDVAKSSGLEVYVDDRFENFVELNNAGICTFLMDAPHNQRYNVGYKRIYSLKDLIQ